MITPSPPGSSQQNEPYLDRNFGGTLVFWDKLFGTFQKELDDIPVEFGTDDHVATDNIFWANNLPWLKLLGIRSLSSSPSRVACVGAGCGPQDCCPSPSC